MMVRVRFGSVRTASQYPSGLQEISHRACPRAPSSPFPTVRPSLNTPQGFRRFYQWRLETED